jgi:hypothetical protein
MMKHRWRLLDAAFVLALMLYVLAGVPGVPFHGDEPMLIYMSRDLELAQAGDWAALMQGPPYEIDQDNQLRILNGSVYRYLFGLVRQAAGFPAQALPPRPGWDWGLDYDTNVATDHLPPPALLLAARFTSAALLALSVPLMFALGWHVGGRPMAYAAAGLYALHPVLLLNGRRAVQEGAMLCFGLLTVLTAAVLVQRANRGQHTALLWPALVAAGALALASKHTGLIFVGSALAWVAASGIVPLRWKRLAGRAAGAALAGTLMLGGWIALSPALWSDPPTRLQDAADVRSNLLSLQVAFLTDGPTTLAQRVASLATAPFLRPLQFYEAPPWAGFTPITDQIAQYMASPWPGYPMGGITGVLLSAALLVGLVTLWLPRSRPRPDWAPVLGVTAWAGGGALALLVSPLDWQRYALPLLPPAVLLAAAGIVVIGRWFVLRWSHSR